MPRKDLMQVRRGTTAEWTAQNPVLAQGEPGKDEDTGVVKWGDGVTPWLDLPATGGGGNSVFKMWDFSVEADQPTPQPGDQFTAGESVFGMIALGAELAATAPPGPVTAGRTLEMSFSASNMDFSVLDDVPNGALLTWHLGIGFAPTAMGGTPAVAWPAASPYFEPVEFASGVFATASFAAGFTVPPIPTSKGALIFSGGFTSFGVSLVKNPMIPVGNAFAIGNLWPENAYAVAIMWMSLEAKW